jgi:hypothetical protein
VGGVVGVVGMLVCAVSGVRPFFLAGRGRGSMAGGEVLTNHEGRVLCDGARAALLLCMPSRFFRSPAGCPVCRCWCLCASLGWVAGRACVRVLSGQRRLLPSFHGAVPSLDVFVSLGFYSRLTFFFGMHMGRRMESGRWSEWLDEVGVGGLEDLARKFAERERFGSGGEGKSAV